MRKLRRILGIDLGERFLKVVEAESGPQGVRILRAKTAPVPEGAWGKPVPERAAGLRDLLERGGFEARDAVLAVPRHLAFLRQIEVPPGSPEELARMIRFQAEKELPLPIDQFRLAYTVSAPAPGSTMIPVTVEAVSRAALEPYLEAASASGVKGVAAAVSTLGMFHAVMRAPGRSGVFGAVACVDIGATMTEIAVLSGERIRFTRSASIGAASRETESAAAWVSSLSGEIERSLRAYAATSGAVPVAEIVVAGGGAVLPDLAATLSSRLGIPTALLAPWAAWPGEKPSDAEAAAFVTAFGLAAGYCSPAGLALDLMADAPVASRWPWRQWSRPLGVAAAAAVLLIGGGLVLAARDGELSGLRARIAEQKPKVDELRGIGGKWIRARRWTDKRLSWIEVMRELTELFPEDIYVTALSFDDHYVMTMSGRTKSDQQVGTLINALNQSPYFGEARFQSIKQNQAKDGYGFDFSLQAQLTPETVVR